MYSDIAWKKGLSGAAALLQLRLLYGNFLKINALADKLAANENLTPAQRAAIEDERTLTRIGMLDNAAGVLGGIAEVMKYSAEEAGKVSRALALEATAALAGSVGAGANAAAMFNKAEGKLREGDAAFALSYTYVGNTYALASGTLGVDAVLYIVRWAAARGLIRLSETGLTWLIVGGGSRALPYVGWAITIVAFVSEGVVSWKDRTPIEKWVDSCCFGAHPAGRDADAEQKAYDEAVAKMAELALTQTDASPPKATKATKASYMKVTH